MSWGPFLPLPLRVWAWDKCRLVSRKTSEEVFFMTRNKKDKSSRCHRKWDTGVWDDGGLKSPAGDDTALALISEQKNIYNRQKKTDAINLEAVNYLRERESGSPAWYLRRGDAGAPRARLHRWWPSSVNIQIKSAETSVSFCVRLSGCQRMNADADKREEKGVGE